MPPPLPSNVVSPLNAVLPLKVQLVAVRVAGALLLSANDNPTAIAIRNGVAAESAVDQRQLACTC